jgi:dipeptidyl aminopeptidase/acylaminoacyl peptidase
MPRAVASQSAFPSWTEEGARILFATNGATGLDFCTIKPDGTDRQIVLSGIKGVDPYTVQLSSNGRYVFFVAAVPGNEGVAKLMTGETPADLHVAAVGARSAKRLENKHPFKQRYAVSPDGKRIVYEVFQDVKMLTGAGKSELWLMRW